jgi:signal transduction histidine kinase/ligand-binding sensor domain-containing protein
MRFNSFALGACALAALPLPLPLPAATNAASNPAPAPAPIIRAWGTEVGLPQNTVTAIAQTPEGYLWLGTRDGLARFDGVRFKTFGVENGLSSVAISSLLADHEGVLWIGTSSAGLCRMAQGRIEPVSDESRRPGSDTITCLAEDATGRVWVGTRAGLRFCRDGKTMEDSAFTSLARVPIISLLSSADRKTMWIGALGVTLQVCQDDRLEPITGPPAHESIIAESLLADRQGRLWVGIGNGVVLCQENNAWRVYDQTNGVPFAFITSMAQDRDGTVWAGSLDDGLYRFDGARFNVLRQADGLSAEDISSLYAGPGGELWVGTRTGGLDRLTQRKLLVVGKSQGLTNDYTQSIAETADGTLWVGTIGGSLYRGGLAGFQPFRPDPRVYFYATVFPVIAPPNAGLWWGGSGALLHWQDERLADCITNEPWVKNVMLTALQEDRHGGLWIGTAAGHLVHMQNGNFKEFPAQITRAAITSLAVRPDDAVWVGTMASGVKLIREDGGAVVPLTNGLSANASVRTLYRDNDGTLWIGTAGEGLSCSRADKVFRFTSSNGFAPRTVSQIVEDDYGSLWLGCSRGIYKFRKGDLLGCADGRLPAIHSRSIDVNDGMPAEECSGGFCPAGLKTRSGLICMSTVKGLVFLDPNQWREEEKPPQVLLEEVLLNGAPQTLKSEDHVPGVTIPPGGRDLEVHYTAIEYDAPERLGFRYKIDELDNDWKEAGPRRAAYFQRVPPGNYTFRVQACNVDGRWNETDTVLELTALPFVWETAWFRAATMFAISGLVAAGLGIFLRRTYKSRLARLQMINAIQRERLRISKDMHDHVGSVLTQVSQLTDMGLVESSDKAQVKNRFERIGDRARVAVQSLDEIVWATNPGNDNLASFAEYVSRFSDEFFEYTNIRCWQEMPPVVPALPLPAEIRHNVFLAAREAFNNALKHSRCTELWLRLKLGDGQIVLEIEDNGAGFDPAKVAPGGNGLSNMQSRLTECGGRAELESAPGKGTRVRFTFPINPVAV